MRHAAPNLNIATIPVLMEIDWCGSDGVYKSDMDKFEKKLCIAFGAYLKDLRNQAKLTQHVVADVCEHSNAQFISNIERGLCWPPMNVLAKMSKLYNVPSIELLDNYAEQRKKIWAREMGIKLNGQH